MRQTLLVQNVFSYYRMCSLTTECVLLLQNVFCPNRTQLTRIVEHAADPGKGSDQVKQEGWQEQGMLAVSVKDDRLTWPERELVRQLGEKLYGKLPAVKEVRHGR